MFRLARMASVDIDLACKVLPSPLMGRIRRSLLRKRKNSRQHFVRLELEPLEERALLSASIFGNVFNDLVGNGIRQGSDPGVPAQVAYLDLNHDGKLDNAINTVSKSSPNMVDLGGVFVSTLHARSLPSQVLNVAVTMDLTNNSSDPLPIVLLSPTGLSQVVGTGDIFQGPYVFTIQPGQHFVGKFDGDAPNSVNNAAIPVANGTYGPQESFKAPQTFIDNVDPNGVWGLLFLPPSGKSDGISLKSWSLDFTQPEPSTQTDAAGNYSFTGLAAGTYDVSLVVPNEEKVTSTGGASQTVTVADGQTVNGVSFGLQPAPDLTSVAFNVASPATSWGQPITIDYTLKNQGAGAAPAFNVDLLLSSNGVISTSGTVLGSPLHFGPLAAGASISGSITETLPAHAPAGFDPNSPATAYVGFAIDPSNLVTETNKNNNSNQGAGVDLALVGGPQADVAVTSATGVQQGPSIAVDPTNPRHLVTAYMSYPAQNGYAGIGIAVSNDGGSSWTNSSVPLPPGFAQGAAAPSVAFDAQGNLFVSFMAVTFLGSLKPSLTNPTSSADRTKGFQSNNGIFVAESSKQGGQGGLSWSQPVAVDANVYTGSGTSAPTQDGSAVPFDAYPEMAIDTSATSPNFGNLYVTWTRYYPGKAAAPQNQYPGGNPSTNKGGSDVMIAVSRDGNGSWTTATQASNKGPISAIRDPFDGPGGGSAAVGNGLVKFSWVTVGAGGAVYVSTDTGGFFTVYSSTNGAQSFQAPLIGPLGGNYSGNPFDYTQTGVLPSPQLDHFRTLRTREIAADPTRPGVLYAVAPSSLAQAQAQPGNLVAANGIVFAVSTDYGASWTSSFTVGSEPSPLAQLTADQINSGYIPVLNDDNAGQYPGFAASQQSQVVSSQVFPSITVSSQGVITVIWYDTRTDPSGAKVEVWGTASSDGGQHFSANFPVSSTSFDPNAGAFTDANGGANFYLGDQIGVAATGSTAYAVWTDTRHGTALTGIQQIFSSKFSLSTLPQAPADRFAPNFTQQTATDLGQVTASQVLPRLSLLPGPANEWFRLQAGATGELSVSVTASSPGAHIQVELRDANGAVLAGAVTNVVDASGSVIGQAVVYPSVSGQTYFAHVSGDSDGGIAYTLTAGTLTADLGSALQGTRTDALAAGAQNVYRLTAAVTGSLVVSLAAFADVQGAGLSLQVLGADGQTALASVTAAAGENKQITIPVTRGQAVLLQMTGADSASFGHYSLEFTIFDQLETASAGTLFFPLAGDPNSLVAADLTHNGKTDLIASSTSGSDSVSVLSGNGDGTFQAEKQFAVGPGLNNGLLPGDRPLAVVNLNGDSSPDILIPNFRAGDVSVLLGRGDGTFHPERRFDAVANPTAVVTGDLNGDGNTDAVVLQGIVQSDGAAKFAVLLGRGDGTFLPPVFYNTAFAGSSGDGPMVIGDFGNGHLDLVIFSKNQALGQIFFGNGDGTFRDGGTFTTGENTFNAQAVDLNGDGKLDLVTTGANTGNVYVMLGNGNGTFQAPNTYLAMAPRPGDNVVVTGLAVVDFGSPAASGAGTPDGHLDIVVTAASRSGAGSAQVILLPGDGSGKFGAPQVLANVAKAGNIATGDFSGNGTTDLAVADKGGVTVIYGHPLTIAPNTTPQTAHNLGSVAHLQMLPRAIVTGYQDAYYTYTVPTEAAPGSGDEVIDFSANFQNVGGAGLQMVVSDASGNLGSGSRFRVVAHQGDVLTVHVLGLPGSAGVAPGFGAYALNIDVLPQVVSVQAQSALPGAPAKSLVITLQGDRLDPATAENPATYTVTWFGPDGIQGTADDQVIPVAATNDGQAVVYDPGANVEVASGLTYATAARQTITLLFAKALPVGSYEVKLSSSIKSAPLNADEAALLAGDSLGGHPLVSEQHMIVQSGSSLVVANLVPSAGTPNPDAIVNGTPFLQQLTNDLTAMLDAQLKQHGDDPAITARINNQILARFSSMMGSGVSVAVVWLDPVSLDLQAPQGGQRASYSLESNKAANSLTRTYVEVGGNVEVVVMAGVSGTFKLDVGDVPATARGGAVVLDAAGTQIASFTSDLRSGTTAFLVKVADAASDLTKAVTPSTDGFTQIAAAVVVGTLLGDIPGATSESFAIDATSSVPAHAATPNAPTVVDEDPVDPADKKVDDKQDRKGDDKQDKNANDKQDDKKLDKIGDKQDKNIDGKQKKEEKKAAEKADDDQDEKDEVEQAALSRGGREALDLALCLFADADDGLMGTSGPGFTFDPQGLASGMLAEATPSLAVADMALVGDESTSRHSATVLSAEPRSSEADACWLALFLAVGACPDAFGASKPDDEPRRKPRRLKGMTAL